MVYHSGFKAKLLDTNLIYFSSTPTIRLQF